MCGSVRECPSVSCGVREGPGVLSGSVVRRLGHSKLVWSLSLAEQLTSHIFIYNNWTVMHA